jgi:hypothetical protein
MGAQSARFAQEITQDAERMAVWVREASHELAQAHEFLDALGVPQLMPGSLLKMPLASRIRWHLEAPPTVPFVSETGQTIKKVASE